MKFSKIGSRQFIDVLEPTEEPTKGKGLYFMDTSSAAAECVTLQAAGGFNIHLFQQAKEILLEIQLNL